MKRVALIGLLLTACAAPTVWVREGATERDFRMEQAQCRVEAGKRSRSNDGSVGGNLADIATGMATLNNCMIGKGWEKKRPQ